MLIVAGRAWTDRIFTQTRIERVAMPVGEFVEQGFWLGASGEDTAHGGQGESAETNGTFEGGTYVSALIVGHER